MTDQDIIERFRLWNDDEAADCIENLIKGRDLARKHLNDTLEMLIYEKAKLAKVMKSVKLIAGSPASNKFTREFAQKVLAELEGWK